MSVRILVESIVNPTEDEKKVERALQNVFPSAKIERATPSDILRLRIQGEGLEFLSTLRNLIKQERIRSAARAILLSGTHGQRIHAHLNKQAAFAGRISFCQPEGESPLGPISIAIDATSPEDVVEYLTHTPDLRHR
jgi:predicted RNA binding protein with dsRBD fold (UPF0201 family)